MQTETPNSTKPSSSSRANRLRQRRFRPQQTRSKRPKPIPALTSVAAGGIIFRRRGKIPEIFFIKDPFGKWTFPKGKQRGGESLIETAVREIREETGLDGLKHTAPLGKTAFRFVREVGLIQKIVHYFLFEAPPDAREKLATHEEVKEGKEPIFEARWVPMDKAFAVSGYKNSDHLLARAFRIIGTRS